MGRRPPHAPRIYCPNAYKRHCVNELASTALSWLVESNDLTRPMSVVVEAAGGGSIAKGLMLKLLCHSQHLLEKRLAQRASAGGLGPQLMDVVKTSYEGWIDSLCVIERDSPMRGLLIN